MYGSNFPVLGTFSVQRQTAAGGTPFAAVIPPFCGSDGNAMQFWPVGNIGSRAYRGRGRTHVSKIIYTTGSTAHLISVFRPLNFSIVKTAVNPSGTTIALQDDPGIFSTNYKYGAQPVQAADRAVAANDYIVVQMADGTWKAAIVVSGTYASLTIAALAASGPTPAIPVGALCYLMGLATDIDPANGQVQPSTQIAASQTRDASEKEEGGFGIIPALHDGDPLLFYSPNTTNQGWLEALEGFYADR